MVEVNSEVYALGSRHSFEFSQLKAAKYTDLLGRTQAMEHDPLQWKDVQEREPTFLKFPKQTVANIIHFRNMLFCNYHFHLVDLEMAQVP